MFTYRAGRTYFYFFQVKALSHQYGVIKAFPRRSKKVADRQGAHCAVASKAVETQWKCFEDAVQSSRTP